jgi:hypothetical protein
MNDSESNMKNLNCCLKPMADNEKTSSIQKYLLFYIDKQSKLSDS